MKPDHYPDAYFETLTDQPVAIKPFDPLSKKAAGLYGQDLDQLLSRFKVRAELFGSTDLEIAGKGEWEYALWLDDHRWHPVLTLLINHFGSIYTMTDDFAVFEDLRDGNKIEIIPMRGDASARNRALMAYWRSNREAVAAYERGKIAHAHSRREYSRWKNRHISDIVKGL